MTDVKYIHSLFVRLSPLAPSL